MPGEGDEDGDVSPAGGDASFDLGAVVARLSDPDPAVHAGAVTTVRRTVDTNPSACLPTTPKLRSILGVSTPDVHCDVAYCLEQLAAESPDDVAPSVSAIVEFLSDASAGAKSADNETSTRLLACLEQVAEERPGAVAEHVETVSDSSPDQGNGVPGVNRESDACGERADEDEATSDEPTSSAVPGRVVNFPVE